MSDSATKATLNDLKRAYRKLLEEHKKVSERLTSLEQDMKLIREEREEMVGVR